MESPQNLPQLALMRQGVDYTFTITCRNFAFVARPLSCFEVVRCAENTGSRIASLPITQRTAVTESIIAVTEKLKLASTSDVNANDAKLTDQMLERCTPDEIDYLFKQYVAGCARVNPSMEEISESELLALVEQVKKSPEQHYALTELSLLHLVGICRLLFKTKDA